MTLTDTIAWINEYNYWSAHLLRSNCRQKVVIWFVFGTWVESDNYKEPSCDHRQVSDRTEDEIKEMGDLGPMVSCWAIQMVRVHSRWASAFAIASWMGTVLFYRAVHIKWQTWKESIANANTEAQCEWILLGCSVYDILMLDKTSQSYVSPYQGVKLGQAKHKEDGHLAPIYELLVSSKKHKVKVAGSTLAIGLKFNWVPWTSIMIPTLNKNECRLVYRRLPLYDHVCTSFHMTTLVGL